MDDRRPTKRQRVFSGPDGFAKPSSSRTPLQSMPFAQLDDGFTKASAAKSMAKPLSTNVALSIPKGPSDKSKETPSRKKPTATMHIPEFVMQTPLLSSRKPLSTHDTSTTKPKSAKRAVPEWTFPASSNASNTTPSRPALGPRRHMHLSVSTPVFSGLSPFAVKSSDPEVKLEPKPFPLDLGDGASSSLATPLARPPPVLAANPHPVTPNKPPQKSKLKHRPPPALQPLKPTVTPRVKVHSAPQVNLSREDKPKLVSIFTTRIANATDPKAEDGLADMLFRGSGDDDLCDEREEVVGLRQSPQKAKVFGEPSYTNGELAATARTVLAKSHNALGLWETATRQQQMRTLRPDIRFVVKNIIEEPKAPTMSALVQCEAITPLPEQTKKAGPAALPVKFSSSPPNDPLVSVLLRFPQKQVWAARSIRSLEEGCEIWVFNPFTVINMGAGMETEDDLYVCERFVLQPPHTTNALFD
ncbi:hypothetical protein CYLTODRAFT_411903 [Cylindrobasidium torrendii FP15055 ss-10]|uniref:Uncharacterized protein n=1 Tax=Cylindrobasidium torrendii FP15055 ss-10 TaxID=1314674 RepID=A0A0D7B734_9AGAR|nr:hypothetical protein CYLTODRAFT_411903 [Cylindrobasidium torrendii FP15055 ss-10]